MCAARIPGAQSFLEYTWAVCSLPDTARDGVFVCSPALAPPATRLGTSGARLARTTLSLSARCAPLSQRRARASRARAPASPAACRQQLLLCFSCLEASLQGPHSRVQAKRGGLKDTLPDDLLLAVFKATLERTGINPAVCHFSGQSPVMLEAFGC